jgi:uncharacterized protein (DUF1800 family)
VEEVSRAIDLLVNQSATAQFISQELAVYFFSDNPPEKLVHQMAYTFRTSDGDIAKTLSTLFHSNEFKSGKYLGKKFKDPVQYVISSARLLYGEHPIENVKPLINWINQLGEPIYNHLTPDGYGITEKDWLSADQMSKRVDIAKAVFGAGGALYVDEVITLQMDGGDKTELQTLRKQAREAHPVDSFGIYDLIRPMLTEQTFNTLRKTLNMDEFNSLLLSSPEFMYR